MREFRMASTGGGTLRCGIWVPAAKPRAVVQLVHGIAEHIGRYDELGNFLAGRGMVLVADDHMGHGLSVGEGETRGFFPSGWLGAVDDEKALMDRVRQEYPDTPYFLLGHSMGSFLTRTFLYRHADSRLAGAVLSGTGWQPAIALWFGLRLCVAEERKHGERACSGALQNVVFGAYNRKFKPARTPNDWICTDEAVVDAYCADPLCGFQPAIGLAREMLRGIQMNQKKENLEAMPKELPVLFFSGAQDPVGNMGRGVERSARAFRAAGLRDVTCRLYPDGRHEMFNEPNRGEVMEDVCRWLEAHL
ncbi:MAG: alpha/beta hydrolase [Oscillospiraceae bacterium]|nr:alpha/beta hydrolase [Oscillospiraceae bacterium]